MCVRGNPGHQVELVVAESLGPGQPLLEGTRSQGTFSAISPVWRGWASPAQLVSRIPHSVNKLTGASELYCLPNLIFSIQVPTWLSFTHPTTLTDKCHLSLPGELGTSQM